jgi:hypothetical protein
LDKGADSSHEMSAVDEGDRLSGNELQRLKLRVSQNPARRASTAIAHEELALSE